MLPSTLVRRNSRVVSQRLAGAQGAVLLHLDTSAYHSINEVGAFIWDLIAEPLPAERLNELVATRFPDGPGSMADDVSEFLQSLSERGLIAFEPGKPVRS